MDFLNYIRQELLVLIPFLYVFGMILKEAEFIKDNFIPLILGIVGIMLSICYVVGDSEAFGVTGLFTAITQGVLCAGAAVYGNQIYKQLKKDNGENAADVDNEIIDEDDSNT